MSSGGLSRRRVGNADATLHDENIPSSPTGSSAGSLARGLSAGSALNGQGGGAFAGSALEGGQRVAFDPRDLDEEDAKEGPGGGRMPRLTIMEEILLLGLKDKQGYLSFWNDNISYALRGCILIELALRKRIALVRDPGRRRIPLADRLVEVIDERQTGETLLDEALKMIKNQQAVEKLGVNSWVDLLSGETWNVMKIGFQLKQVRERLAKGLVDKGVLRTEKRNFLLFDMATHPVADVRTKDAIVARVVALLTSSTAAVPANALDKEGTQCRAMRAVCLVCAAYAASVLDNALAKLTYEDREGAFQRCDEILGEFSVWPVGSASGSSGGSSARTGSARRQRIGIGEGRGPSGREVVVGLVQEVKKESEGDEDVCFELVAAVVEVLSKLDSLL